MDRETKESRHSLHGPVGWGKSKYFLFIPYRFFLIFLILPLLPAFPGNAASAETGGQGMSEGGGEIAIPSAGMDYFSSSSPDLIFDTDLAAGSDWVALGVGKGGTGTTAASPGAGLSYCKLGTGCDSNSNITGERYVFGPNLSIYFGARYTYLTSARWCGRGWYRPDGTIFNESKYEYQIPSPADYGYSYWEWYNVYFNYAPMPSGMRSLEGNWTAVWWDNGSNNCSKTYTVMYDLYDHTMCQEVQELSPFDPNDITYDFDGSDEKCCSWLHLKNYALNQANDIQWRWYRPDGVLYLQEEKDIPNPGTGSWHGWYKIWSWIDIAGASAAYPGTWHVEVYIKDYQGNAELKYTEYFTIGNSGEPDIEIQPMQLSLLCGSEEPVQGFSVSSEKESLIEPQQSTTGPVPPRDVLSKNTSAIQAEAEGMTRTLSVPAYGWRHGCGPTTVGMVIGYYDSLGYEDLIPGDAGSQTAEVDQAIASQGSVQDPRHYEDYSLPDDSAGSILLPDKSEWPAGDEHSHDSIADFMKTSWSSVGNFYGWSWSDDIGPAFQDYVNLKNPDYEPSYQFYSKTDNALTWEVLTQEIDAERPMVFLVDTEGDGLTDHFVTVVGYRDTPVQQYGCLDTWESYDVVRWCDFATIQTGQSWGVWGGWSFQLASLIQNSFAIANVGTALLTVQSIVPDVPASWLDWNPKPPFTIHPGEQVVVTITADCALAPCTDSTTRLWVYSDDPDESPYPGGVDITVYKPELTGDCNRNCMVDSDDLILFVNDWLYQGCDSESDLFRDCKVDLSDFAVLSKNWLSSME